jgi:hypothetical protein
MGQLHYFLCGLCALSGKFYLVILPASLTQKSIQKGDNQDFRAKARRRRPQLKAEPGSYFFDPLDSGGGDGVAGCIFRAINFQEAVVRSRVPIQQAQRT